MVGPGTWAEVSSECARQGGSVATISTLVLAIYRMRPTDSQLEPSTPCPTELEPLTTYPVSWQEENANALAACPELPCDAHFNPEAAAKLTVTAHASV